MVTVTLEDDRSPGAMPEVAWIDEHLAVIEKPAGLVVHPAPSHRGPTLVDLLSEIVEGGPSDRPGIVHRLDRETSGLLVVGRSDEAVRALQGLIHERRLQRRYLALVAGRPKSRTGRVEAPIGRSTRHRHRMAVGGAAPREAVTEFEVIESLRTTSLLELRLETGRTHQIRVHMQAIGHPVVGDPEYGGSKRFDLARQFLHSHRIEFDHPFSGEAISVASDLPADLRRALEAARAE